VRPVYQADAAQYDWERGRLYLRRWRVYEFIYVIDNKNDQDIDHFYLEVRTLTFHFWIVRHSNYIFLTTAARALHTTASEEVVGADRDGGAR
jgi:hypothetical protein